MKTLGKKSLSAYLKTAVTMAWYLELIFTGCFVFLFTASIFNLLPNNVGPLIPGSDNIDGSQMVQIESTNDGLRVAAWFNPIFLFILLYITFLLKRILNSLTEGTPFTLENSNRIRYISYAIISWPLLGFVFKAIHLIKNIVVNNNPIHVDIFNLSFFDFKTLFLGLIVLVIAEIFKIGYIMQEEQKMVI